MSSLPSAIMNSGGGTKKPFSYCPGGIDFSELKNPKTPKPQNPKRFDIF